MPLLALWMVPLAAAAMRLPVFIVSDMAGVWRFRRDFDSSNLAILIPASLRGVLIATLLAPVLPAEAFLIATGLIGLAYCARSWLARGRNLPPRPADLPRGGRVGVVAAMQPGHLASDWRMAMARMGEARLQGAYAWKAMLDNRVPLAFGSDVPVESANPFPGIAVAMTRQDAQGEPVGGWMPQQRVSFQAALDGFTRQAAYAGFAEKKFGSLIPGQRADFLLIDRDISSAQPADIRATQVLETWIGGKRVYVKGQ